MLYSLFLQAATSAPKGAETTGSQTPIWAFVVAGIIVAAFVILVILYFQNERVHEALSPTAEAFADLFESKSSITIRKLDKKSLDGLMSAIGLLITKQKYLPQSQASGLYVYQKHEKPGCLIAFILLCIFIIPGILYLVLGGKTKVITIHIADVPGGYKFNIEAPGGVKGKIAKILDPYRVKKESVAQKTPAISMAPEVPPVVEEAPVAEQEVTITRDIVIEGETAFQIGEQVTIEAVSPDVNRPDYKYVIRSKKMGKKFRLSDRDISPD